MRTIKDVQRLFIPRLPLTRVHRDASNKNWFREMEILYRFDSRAMLPSFVEEEILIFLVAAVFLPPARASSLPLPFAKRLIRQ